VHRTCPKGSEKGTPTKLPGRNATEENAARWGLGVARRQEIMVAFIGIAASG